MSTGNRPLADLIQQLSHEDSRARSRAAEEICRQAENSTDAIIPLIEVLNDDDEYVRFWAVQALGAIGPDASDAIPSLIERLQDEESKIQKAALGSIDAIGIGDHDVSGLAEGMVAYQEGIMSGLAGLMWGPSADEKRRIPRLIKALDDEKAYVRSRTCEELVPMSFHAKEAMPKLVKALDDEDKFVRLHAAEALESIGDDSPEMFAKWQEILSKPNHEGRVCAAVALSHASPAPVDVVPVLVGLLSDSEDEVRKNAAKAIDRSAENGTDITSALPALFDAFQDNTDVQYHASEALKKLENIPTELHSSVEALLTSESHIALETGLLLLPKIGESAKKHEPTVRQMMSHESEEVRNAALNVIGALTNDPESTLKELLTRLGDEDEFTRRAAATSLGHLARAEAVDPLLTQIEKEDNDNTICVMAVAMGQIGPAAKKAVPKLLEIISRGDYISEDVAEAVSCIGVDDLSLVPNLVHAHYDPRDEANAILADLIVGLGRDAIRMVIIEMSRNTDDWDKLRFAGRILRRLRAGKALAKALKSKHARIRFSAAFALSEMGKRAIKAIPALIEALDDKSEKVRDRVFDTLEQLGPVAAEATPALITRLGDQDWRARSMARDALVKIGEAAVPLLTEALKHQDEDVRSESCSALGSIGESAKDAVSELIPLLSDLSNRVRASAAHALGEIGTDSEEAVKQLLEMLNSEDHETASSAARALGKLKVESAIPILVERMENWSEDTPEIDALGAMGEVALPAVQEMLQRPQRPYQMINLLAALGRNCLPILEDVVPIIFDEFLADDNYDGNEYASSLVRDLTPEIIPVVVEKTKDADERMRAGAVSTMACFHGEDAIGHDEIVRSLGEDKSALVRREVVNYLGYRNLDPDDLGLIVNALADEDYELSSAAQEILLNQGRRAEEIAPMIVDLIKQSDKKSGLDLSTILGFMGKSIIPLLLDLLKDENPHARAEAVRALSLIEEPSEDIVAPLLEAMSDSEAKVRSAAAQCLGNAGKAAKDAIPVLLEALKDEKVKDSAIDALGKIGCQPKVVIPALIELLAEEREEAYYHHSLPQALASFKKKAMPYLAEASKSDNATVRLGVVETYGEMYPKSEEVIDAYVKALDDPDGKVRARAASQLADLHGKAKVAEARLIELLEDPVSGVRFNAARALGEIRTKDPKAIEILVRSLDEEDWTHRTCIVSALSTIGKLATVPLTEALKSENHNKRDGAWRALWSFQFSDSEKAMQGLINTHESDNEEVRMWVAATLVGHEPKSSAAVPALTTALKHKEARIRGKAAELLGNLGDKAKDAVASMIELLDDEDDTARLGAVSGLGKMRATAKDAITKLESVKESDSNEGIRQAAEAALSAIRY